MVGAPLQTSPFIVRHKVWRRKKVFDALECVSLVLLIVFWHQIQISISGTFAPVQLCKCHLSFPAGEVSLESWSLTMDMYLYLCILWLFPRQHLHKIRTSSTMWAMTLETSRCSVDAKLMPSNFGLCSRCVFLYKLAFCFYHFIFLISHQNFFFSFKARGEDYMEDIVDNTFAMTDYLEELVNSWTVEILFGF